MWILFVVLVALAVLDAVLPGGPRVPWGWWAVAVVFVIGTAVLGVRAARQTWTVTVTREVLTVGGDRLRIADIDVAHLRAQADGEPVGGVDAGAPVLGGGYGLPKGRAALPVRRTDGAGVQVPTRHPVALRTAMLQAADPNDARRRPLA